MKEATGELNMTVVTVVAIAAIAAFFYAFVWPGMKASLESNQKCAGAICNCNKGASTCDCQYYDDSGNLKSGLKCPNKNK